MRRVDNSHLRGGHNGHFGRARLCLESDGGHHGNGQSFEFHVDNNAANNVATLTISPQTAQAAAVAAQALVQSKPTAQTPIVIQSIAPTLTENFIIVELAALVEQRIDIHIINALGTIVLTEKMAIERGNNKRQLDVSQLPKGLYLIQTSVGKGRNVPMKFVKY
jgi:Secretion system C-terminal sorting domain